VYFTGVYLQRWIRMNQAEVSKLVSALRFKVQPRGWIIPTRETVNRGQRGQLTGTHAHNQHRKLTISLNRIFYVLRF
jgi:hypothetical protein